MGTLETIELVISTFRLEHSKAKHLLIFEYKWVSEVLTAVQTGARTQRKLCLAPSVGTKMSNRYESTTWISYFRYANA